jgi:hypothetical protein
MLPGCRSLSSKNNKTSEFQRIYFQQDGKGLDIENTMSTAATAGSGEWGFVNFGGRSHRLRPAAAEGSGE